ncbi:MAG: HD domain-containing protein [Candidatus Levybacteria bacterium]|nr:HD domain-containing protein [Candidatus Levybacteria bacterium]
MSSRAETKNIPYPPILFHLTLGTPADTTASHDGDLAFDDSIQRVILLTEELVVSPIQRFPERKDPDVAYDILCDILRAEGKYTDQVPPAMKLAFIKHKDIPRKVSGRSEFIHIADVVFLIAQYALPYEITAACLHDFPENNLMSLFQIKAAFGPRVARIVDQLTEKKPTQMNAGPEVGDWLARKIQQIKDMQKWPPSTVLIKTADFTSNLGDIIDDTAEKGLKAYTKLSAGPVDQLNRSRMMINAFQTYENRTHVLNPLLPNLRQLHAILGHLLAEQSLTRRGGAVDDDFCPQVVR